MCRTEKGRKLASKAGISKSSKFLGKCYKYDKVGHKSSNYKKLKKPSKKKEANIIEGISKDMSNIDFRFTLFIVNLTESNPRERWIDIRATRHVCYDKAIFFSLQVSNAGDELYMWNSSASTI